MPLNSQFPPFTENSVIDNGFRFSFIISVSSESTKVKYEIVKLK